MYNGIFLNVWRQRNSWRNIYVISIRCDVINTKARRRWRHKTGLDYSNSAWCHSCAVYSCAWIILLYQSIGARLHTSLCPSVHVLRVLCWPETVQRWVHSFEWNFRYLPGEILTERKWIIFLKCNKTCFLIHEWLSYQLWIPEHICCLQYNGHKNASRLSVLPVTGLCFLWKWRKIVKKSNNLDVHLHCLLV